MRRALTGLLLIIVFVPGLVSAHCEVPCGIFSDALRIEMLYEHVTTMEKAMNQIVALSAEDDADYNQIVRWVTTKDEHAEEFQHVVSQYFLHQRVKPSDADDAEYVNKLTLLHRMLVGAMRCKQNTDTAHTEQLREHVDAFAEAYFGPEELQHLHDHRPHEND
jgi:nickel superoxide dismutase